MVLLTRSAARAIRVTDMKTDNIGTTGTLKMPGMTITIGIGSRHMIDATPTITAYMTTEMVIGVNTMIVGTITIAQITEDDLQIGTTIVETHQIDVMGIITQIEIEIETHLIIVMTAIEADRKKNRATMNVIMIKADKIMKIITKGLHRKIKDRKALKLVLKTFLKAPWMHRVTLANQLFLNQHL